jgi:hypothetical protein
MNRSTKNTISCEYGYSDKVNLAASLAQAPYQDVHFSSSDRNAK